MSSTGLPTAPLSIDAVPVGTPLEWPVVDGDGTLLFERGAILVNVEERRFLFDHFTPERGDLPQADRPGNASAAPPFGREPLTVRDMHLTIGALIGVRQQSRTDGPMSRCRIIGFAPNEALFATPPVINGRILPLSVGENVELVVITRQTVFRFVCTVEAVCQLPFNYLILSKPGLIRPLRVRESIRVRTRLAVRYGIGATGDTYDGLGLAQEISAQGMSLTASCTLGRPGDRLRVAFQLRSGALDTHIETGALIRNVRQGTTPASAVVHGLQLDQLTPAQQMALKVFVFEHQEDTKPNP